MIKYYWLLLLSSILFSKCSGSKPSIEHELVQKCIEAHGGLAQWHSLKSTDYTKHITLFYEDGEIEKEIVQSHHYSLSPNLSGIIEWTDSINRKIVYQDGQAYKINGIEKEEPTEASLDAFNSAYYVLNMPWKLFDESAVITYHGVDTIFNNNIVHTLKVEYSSEDQNDVWEYYLDAKEYYLVGNKVWHGSTASLITNEEYVWYKGLRFNAKRSSFMVDSIGEILFLRAKYEYSFVN